MDAITLLKEDHKSVEQLFKHFEKAADRAFVEKRALVDRIIEALAKHAAIEEQLFYPIARATVPGVEDIALESLEEHHIVKWVLSELDSMDPDDERFDAKVTVLIENVRHHVEEEESDFFPKVRDELGRNALSELGDAMAEAKKVAPTHVHPRSPDTPPGNLTLGASAGVPDRLGDTVNGLAQGGVSAIGDLIATVLGRKKPRSSPRGSSTTRRVASKVRAEASEATDVAIAGTRRAQRVGRSTTRSAARGSTTTARAARAGARATTTSARRSTKPVVTTAKRASSTTGHTARKAVRSTATTAKRAAHRPPSTAGR